MGFLLLLNFALLCIDFLAWPVIALGYPLFASIRAIETGSIYHMRKLVIYWTLFSIISLFEYALVRIIDWIPFWSSIKLVAIFWLVIPRFRGACHAYRSFVHPHLVVNLQELIKSLYKPKDEQPHTKKEFLDVAEKYIKENGSEAFEKLIASKMELKEPVNSHRGVQLVEPDENNVTTAPKQMKEPNVVQKDKEMLAAPEKSASTEKKQSQVYHPRPTPTACWVPKETTYTAAKIKDITSPETSSENRQPPSKKFEQEWMCPLCPVTTTCERNLSDHLQGKKHKSMCESLKTSKLNAQDTRPSSSTSKDGSQQESCEGKTQEKREIQVVEPDENNITTAPKQVSCEGKTQEKREIQVVEPDENNITIALKQLKEPDAVQRDKETLEAPDKIASTEAKQVHHPRPTPTTCWVPKETTYTAAKTKEITSPETSSENRQPPSKQVEREWTCPLCQVTTSCEKNLSDHLQGEKHKSMCESLKTSKLNAQNTRPSSSTSKDGSQQESCEVKTQEKREIHVVEPDENNITTAPKQLNEPDAVQKDKEMLEASDKIASTEVKQPQVHHLRPTPTACVPNETTYTAAKTKEITLPETSSENRQPLSKKVEREWTCPLCQVTTTCERDLSDHLQGKKHKFMCESLKTSKLNAQDTRPSSSTSKDGSQQESCEGKTQEKRGIQVVEPDENNITTAPKQLKEPDAVLKDKEMLEAPDKIASTEAKQLQVHHPRPITKETCTAAKRNDKTSPETSSENRQPPLKKVEPRWTCPLCQVITTCEKNLHDHIQGKKHKSECESLKTSKLQKLWVPPPRQVKTDPSKNLLKAKKKKTRENPKSGVF